jgi:hypothetical protein
LLFASLQLADITGVDASRFIKLKEKDNPNIRWGTSDTSLLLAPCSLLLAPCSLLLAPCSAEGLMFNVVVQHLGAALAQQGQKSDLWLGSGIKGNICVYSAEKRPPKGGHVTAAQHGRTTQQQEDQSSAIFTGPLI